MKKASGLVGMWLLLIGIVVVTAGCLLWPILKFAAVVKWLLG